MTTPACAGTTHPGLPEGWDDPPLVDLLALASRSTYTSPVVPEGSAGDAAFRFRYRLPGLAKQSEVLSHCFAHELFGLSTGVSLRHDTRQIW